MSGEEEKSVWPIKGLIYLDLYFGESFGSEQREFENREMVPNQCIRGHVSECKGRLVGQSVQLRFMAFCLPR